jgi:isoleucyl-tRNA synthetase
MVILNDQDIRPKVPVDEAAVFTQEVPDYAGQFVFDANKQILRDLRDKTGPISRIPENERPVYFKQQSIVHSYPHCWRCRNPLIYKPVSSWFVKVTAIKDRMLELNENINWIPENVKAGQFGKWLANARDWSISRNRYWGAPIPVWVSDDPKYPRIDVYGSIAELERDFGVKVHDLHRPFIDTLTRPNPDDPTGKSTMRRIEDVFDCWFESGSMSFAQVHYPFENKEWFNNHFPGDFIVEYIGQTRGWFYTMHVMATALFNCNAFTNVICHGIVLGSDGQKMSKSLRNYPNVTEVFDRDGSDAMRWFLMSSSILRGGNLVVTEQAIRDATRQVLLPLWSSYYFFTLYANAANNAKGIKARKVLIRELDSLENLDSYIIKKTLRAVKKVQDDFDAFDISAACADIETHLDVLTNWYIRNARDRFWREDENAFNTLYTVLLYTLKIMAPLAPAVTDKIWQGLTGEESIHLTDWPNLESAHELRKVASADDDEIKSMDLVRSINSSALALRKKHGIRVRQPLQSLEVVIKSTSEVEPYLELLKRELNIKEVLLKSLKTVSREDYGIVDRLTVNPRALGPRLGKLVQEVIIASKSGNWTSDSNGLVIHTKTAGDIKLELGEYELSTVIEVGGSGAAGAAGAGVADQTTASDVTLLKEGGFIVLNLEITDALEQEGYVRDLIRDVQDARKKANFDVADRIALTLKVPHNKLEAVNNYKDLLCSETLTVELHLNSGDETQIEVSQINNSCKIV